MIPVLSPDGEEMIARLAADRALLVFDFDGTLAPIVADRDRASMRLETRGLLRAAGVLYPGAIVSGRDRADVARRVANVPVVEVIGNHGAEDGAARPDPTVGARVGAWVTALEAVVAGLPGVELEQKALSVAVHYRRADLRSADIARLAARAAQLPGSRVFGGDAVVNVVPADAWTKGGAIERLATRQRARSVMFVGDDVTDEDAFRSAAVTCPVRVGATGHSAARWFLRDQREIDALLEELIEARTALGARGDGWSTAPGAPGAAER